MTVAGFPATKPARMVAPDAAIELVTDDPAWASRAGAKLDAALDRFEIDVADRRVLDVGASTGGFTDVVLRRGAASVVAVDVGYGQMVTRLATDPRVSVVDRTNIRHADPGELGAPFDVVTVDVSFISVATLAEQLAAMGRDGTDFVILVKPQFEAGREAVGRGGIVTDPEAHASAVSAVVDALAAVGAGAVGVMASPITGTKGNREFLVHARFGVATSVSGVSIDEVAQ